MKRFVILFASLLVGGLASAQNEKVVTPHEVNPSGEAVALTSPDAEVASSQWSAPARGKWYVGLGGGLDYTSAYGWDICIAPDVSYKVSNALFVGGQVSYSYSRGQSLAGVFPYLRWHIVPLGKAVSVFVTAYAPCEFWKDYLHLGARVKPGLAVRFAEGAYVMGSFGSFGYSYFRSGGTEAAGWVRNTDIDTISLGVLFSL